MTMPSSITRFVEASRNASEGASSAPFWNSARVPDRAEKLHELERKPKNVPSATLRGPVSPMWRCIRSRITRFWIRLLIR